RDFRPTHKGVFLSRIREWMVPDRIAQREPASLRTATGTKRSMVRNMLALVLLSLLQLFARSRRAGEARDGSGAPRSDCRDLQAGAEMERHDVDLRSIL